MENCVFDEQTSSFVTKQAPNPLSDITNVYNAGTQPATKNKKEQLQATKYFNENNNTVKQVYKALSNHKMEIEEQSPQSLSK